MDLDLHVSGGLQKEMRVRGDRLDLPNDRDFEDFVQQDFVHLVQVDLEVGTAARRLLRRFPELRKPQDAIHAATAILSDVDELHTFDG